MPNQSSSQASQSGNSQGPAMPGNKGNSGKMIIYLIAVVVVILIVVGIVLLLSSSSSPSVVVAQNHSLNTTPVYMSPSQAELIVGAPLSNYYTSDLFNPASEVNMTDLVSAIPQLYDNVTSGWITSATGSNTTQNATIQFYVLQTNNNQEFSTDLGSVITSSLNMSPQAVSPGTDNGLDYTYSVYKNSTAEFQVLYGWKQRNAIVILVQANPVFSTNETELLDVAANDTV